MPLPLIFHARLHARFTLDTPLLDALLSCHAMPPLLPLRLPIRHAATHMPRCLRHAAARHDAFIRYAAFVDAAR